VKKKKGKKDNRAVALVETVIANMRAIQTLADMVGRTIMLLQDLGEIVDEMRSDVDRLKADAAGRDSTDKVFLP
jgi:hypothetical protein